MALTRVRALRQPLVLFLDDYHLAQSPTSDALIAGFLGHPFCRNLRLVIISRTPARLPLSTLRLEGDLRQIGMAELRFTRAETLEFLGDTAASLTPAQIDAMMQRAEGWPVALQMMRVLVREAADGTSNALAALNLPGRDEDMGRFLSEQVVSSLPSDLRKMLFATAVLPELSPDLVVAVTGDGGARNLFFQLADCALPFASLDEAGHWLRLHPVFREFLAEEGLRQGIDQTGVLRRAVDWFESRGDIDRALAHAMRASEPGLAMAVLERGGGWRLIYRSHRGGGPLFRAIGEVAGIDWTKYPLTTLGFAIFHAKAGQIKAAGHYLRLVETTADPTNITLAR